MVGGWDGKSHDRFSKFHSDTVLSRSSLSKLEPLQATGNLQQLLERGAPQHDQIARPDALAVAVVVVLVLVRARREGDEVVGHERHMPMQHNNHLDARTKHLNNTIPLCSLNNRATCTLLSGFCGLMCLGSSRIR